MPHLAGGSVQECSGEDRPAPVRVVVPRDVPEAERHRLDAVTLRGTRATTKQFRAGAEHDHRRAQQISAERKKKKKKAGPKCARLSKSKIRS